MYQLTSEVPKASMRGALSWQRIWRKAFASLCALHCTWPFWSVMLQRYLVLYEMLLNMCHSSNILTRWKDAVLTYHVALQAADCDATLHLKDLILKNFRHLTSLRFLKKKWSFAFLQRVAVPTTVLRVLRQRAFCPGQRILMRMINKPGKYEVHILSRVKMFTPHSWKYAQGQAPILKRE